MRVGNWWIREGILFDSINPEVELAHASTQFGDEYYPAFFASGCGHQATPFLWTLPTGKFGNVFSEAAAENKVCCYVERHQADVDADNHSVPLHFNSVYQNGKVYGWELPVFRHITPVALHVLEVYSTLNFGRDVCRRFLIQVLGEIHGLYLDGVLSNIYNQNVIRFMEMLLDMKEDKVSQAMLGLRDHDFAQLVPFLDGYYLGIMNYRTEVHNQIGANIQRRMNQYPDHFHLISVGSAHLEQQGGHRPIQDFLRPPPGVFGVIDVSKVLS